MRTSTVFWPAFVLLVSQAALDAAERPNFAIILADDLGYGDIGSRHGKKT